MTTVRVRARAILPAVRGWMAMVVLAGCTRTEDGYVPAGAGAQAPVDLERYLRRVYVDLVGRPPDDAERDAAVAELEADHGVAARAALADGLMAGEEFATAWFESERARIWREGSASVEEAYGFVCTIARDGLPECADCADADPAAPCEGCDCEPLVYLRGDRDRVAAAAGDLAAGTIGTVEVQRRLAESAVMAYFLAPEAVVDALFEGALGRPPGPDERRNGAAIYTGSLLGPERNAGLLMHRHGRTREDLFDIVFESRAYPEGVATLAFRRFLGRDPTPDELIHFARRVAAEDGDARALIRDLVSSREYLEG